MADNKKSKPVKKTKADIKRQRYIYFMALLVIVTMVFSGAYFLGEQNSPGNGGNQDNGNDLYYGKYSVTPIGNMSLIVTALRPGNELIALSETQCVNRQTAGWVLNSSVQGLKGVSLEVANPYTSPTYSICGELIFFRFAFDNINTSTVSRLDGSLKNTLGSYIMKRGYTGVLSGNVTGLGTDKVYVIGSPEVKVGDKAFIFLFQKLNDATVFALERRIIPEGPVVEATVKGVEGYMAGGVLTSDFDPTAITNAVNVTDMRIYPPKIVADSALDNETVEQLNGLRGVAAQVNGNSTDISFNSSEKNITGILEMKNVSYSLTNGSASFRMPIDANISTAALLMTESGIKEQELMEIGILQMPAEVILNGNVAEIQDNENFNALLKLGRKKGDVVNITLSILQFGEQSMIIGAREI